MSINRKNYDWDLHFPKMLSLYYEGISIADITREIQDKEKGFEPEAILVYFKFKKEGYPTDKNKRAQFLQDHKRANSRHRSEESSLLSPGLGLSQAFQSDDDRFIQSQPLEHNSISNYKVEDTMVEDDFVLSHFDASTPEHLTDRLPLPLQFRDRPWISSGDYSWEASKIVKPGKTSSSRESYNLDGNTNPQLEIEPIAQDGNAQERGLSGYTPPVPIQTDSAETAIFQHKLSVDGIEEAFELGYMIGSRQTQREEDELSNTSNVSGASSLPSVVDSIFTMASGSSMSSVCGPQGAGERFVALLLEDNELSGLVSEGLLIVEQERFERNFRRLLKELANGLLKESRTEQQRRTAKFVRLRARNTAHTICRQMSGVSRETPLDIGLWGKSKEAEDEDWGSEGDDSNPSEDELETFQHLEVFIKTSLALEALRKTLRIFLFHKNFEKRVGRRKTDAKFHEADHRSGNGGDALGTKDGMREEPMIDTDSLRTEEHTMFGSTHQAPQSLLDGIRLHLRLKRPQVPPGKTRVEWQCRCGKRIYDDFIELVPGAADRMKQLVTHSDTGSTTTSRMNSLASTFSSRFKSFSSFFAVSSRSRKNSLPLHERDTQLPQGSPTPQDADISQPDSQFLPICYREGRYATRLMQPDLVTQNINSDRSLFELLRKSYQATTGKVPSFFSLQTLSSIRFVHFELYCSALVDVKKVDDIPPPEHLEYRYAPVPPELIPPIGHNHLMHLFHSPDCAATSPVLMLRFPKKLIRRLSCPKLNPLLPGWGIEFLTTYSLPKLFLLFSMFFGLGSLVFSVLWCVFKHSIQDAFAIAAYVVAFGGISVGTIQALLAIR